MNAQQALPNLTLKQKLLGGLGLVGFGVIAFATAGIVFTIMAALLIISSVALGARWLWCKITGKPFLPGIAAMRVQMEQIQRPFNARSSTSESRRQTQRSSSGKTTTIEGEYHRVDNER